MTTFHRYFPIVLLLPLVLMVGCIPSQPVSHREKHFEINELDACLAILIDTSGSFINYWDDRAYPLFLELMDQFFTEGQGEDSRIIIGQLSGSDDVVLFEGTPSELRNRFRTPEELSDFLRKNSNPNSSHVYEATRKTVDYVTRMPRVTDQTRLMCVILSDMADNSSDEQGRIVAGRAMVASLKRYQEKRGGLALYYVSQDEVPRWQRILTAANFEPGQYVIENSLIENPQLPRFE